MSRSGLAWVAACLIATIGACTLYHLRGDAARKEAIALAAEIVLDEERQIVLERCAEARFARLRCRSADSVVSVITGSSIIPSRDWVLYVDIVDERVAGVRFRTVDSERFRPPEAPADRVKEM